MTAFHAQTERKRQDKSVRFAEKPDGYRSMTPVDDLICPNRPSRTTAAAIRSTERLTRRSRQLILTLAEWLYGKCQHKGPKMKKLAAALLVSGFVAGCATNPNQIQPTYVSPMVYEDFSCSQLSREAQRISARAAEATGAQEQQANNDAVATGVSLVLFWPTAFFIGGDGEIAAQLARLKGELEAVEQASIAKGCGIEFRRS